MKGLSKPYKIEAPVVRSWNYYQFVTDSGVTYEVRFGRKQDNILHVTIAFGVLNEEYEGDEYTETNKGEVFRVMATVIEIMSLFEQEHSHTMVYEFTGERRNHEHSLMAIRTKLYYRYLKRLLNDNWMLVLKQDAIVIRRINMHGKGLFA